MDPLTDGGTGPLTPAEFLDLVADAAPGWSARFGGPEGVERLTVALQAQVSRQAVELAAVRAAALQEMLATRSAADVAQQLGMSRQAVWKASRADAWTDPRW